MQLSYFIVKNGVVTTKVNTVTYNYTKPTAKLDPNKYFYSEMGKRYFDDSGSRSKFSLMGKIIESNNI